MKEILKTTGMLLVFAIAVIIMAIAWLFGAPAEFTFSKTLPNGQAAKIKKKYRWFWLISTELIIEKK